MVTLTEPQTQALLEQIVLDGENGYLWVGLFIALAITSGVISIWNWIFDGDGFLTVCLAVLTIFFVLGALGNYDHNTKKVENPEYYLEKRIKRAEQRLFMGD